MDIDVNGIDPAIFIIRCSSRIPDTMEGADIDAVGYAVLTCLDSNGALWKKKVCTWVNDHADRLPVAEPRSMQTVGRRIDTFHEHGLVESCILRPDSVNRDMIIGYRITEEGQDVLEAARNELLRSAVTSARDHLLSPDSCDDDAPPVDRTVLITLMTNAFDISTETRDEVLPRINTRELFGLLAAHYFLDNADTTFDAGHEDALDTLLRQTPQLRRPFEQDTLISRLRERATAAEDTEQSTVPDTG